MEAGHNDTVTREQQRIEFYATYDVMTGIRIAATLGGFFGLMVFLVIYKSRSKSVKALKDPKIVEIAEAAVADEEAEEEERQLAYALEEALGARCSISGSSGWAPWPPRLQTARFSSVGGGYSSLLAPPRRLSKMRGDSLPASALQFNVPRFYEDDVEITDAIDDSSCAAPSEYANRFLSVPGGSRRFSSVTCSSSGSSYLERRGSSLVCALPTHPPTPRSSRNNKPRRYTVHASDPWESCNLINITVIQPTPELSPCVSENTILDCGNLNGKRTINAPSVQTARKLAPLASLSSCGASLSVDYQDYDLHSVGSDSVFVDEEDCLDTDDEIEQFSTDSDDSLTYKKRYNFDESKELRSRRRSRHIVGKSVPVTMSPPSCASSTLLSHGSRSPLVRKHHSFLSKPITRRALRRLSHPTIVGKQGCSTISAAVAATNRADSSTISEESNGESSKIATKMFTLPFYKKDREDADVIKHSKSQDVELGCRSNAALTELKCQSPTPLNPEHCSWSQETLF